MKGKLIWSIFWAMVGVFVIVIIMILNFIPPLRRLGVTFTTLPAIAGFFLLGVTLLVLTVKTKVRGMLKGFLLLTGASAVGLLVCALLHNVVSALFNTEEPVFFLMGLIVCPIAFLVGAVGSIVLAIKTKPSVPARTS
jgi:hypothetical protein